MYNKYSAMTRDDWENFKNLLPAEDQLFCECHKEIIELIKRYKSSLPIDRIINMLIMTGCIEASRIYTLEDSIDKIKNLAEFSLLRIFEEKRKE